MTAPYRRDLRGLADWLEYNADIQRNHPLPKNAAWGDKLTEWARAVRRAIKTRAALTAFSENAGRGSLQERRDSGRGDTQTGRDNPSGMFGDR